MRRTAWAAFAAVCLGSCVALAMPAFAQLAAGPQAQLATALADQRRSDDRARDGWRHPAETLAFFRVEPGMRVVDYMPAEGWYSRVLIPYLGSEGTYIGLNPDIDPRMTGYWDSYRGMAAKLPGEAREWTMARAPR